MLEKFKAHPVTTILGIVGAALGAFATTVNLDKLSAGQAALAFAGCLWVALQGALSADATNPKA